MNIDEARLGIVLLRALTFARDVGLLSLWLGAAAFASRQEKVSDGMPA